MCIRDSEQTVLKLLERGVWVHPGYFFGMPESGWLVVKMCIRDRRNALLRNLFAGDGDGKCAVGRGMERRGGGDSLDDVAADRRHKRDQPELGRDGEVFECH